MISFFSSILNHNSVPHSKQLNAIEQQIFWPNTMRWILLDWRTKFGEINPRSFFIFSTGQHIQQCSRTGTLLQWHERCRPLLGGLHLPGLRGTHGIWTSTFLTFKKKNSKVHDCPHQVLTLCNLIYCEIDGKIIFQSLIWHLISKSIIHYHKKSFHYNYYLITVDVKIRRKNEINCSGLTDRGSLIFIK